MNTNFDSAKLSQAGTDLISQASTIYSTFEELEEVINSIRSNVESEGFDAIINQLTTAKNLREDIKSAITKLGDKLQELSVDYEKVETAAQTLGSN